MNTTGIDFGASKLGVAVSQTAYAALIRHPYFSERMPFVLEFLHSNFESRLM